MCHSESSPTVGVCVHRESGPTASLLVNRACGPATAGSTASERMCFQSRGAAVRAHNFSLQGSRHKIAPLTALPKEARLLRGIIIDSGQRSITGWSTGFEHLRLQGRLPMGDQHRHTRPMLCGGGVPSRRQGCRPGAWRDGRNDHNSRHHVTSMPLAIYFQHPTRIVPLRHTRTH